jgi:hypothetical protein
MNEAESKNYMRGQRKVYRELLGTALRGLGRDDGGCYRGERKQRRAMRRLLRAAGITRRAA